MFRPLRRFSAAGALVFLAAAQTPTADAQGLGGASMGFQPFGFYQPYGAFYGTTLSRPPHFALNPPVYYGARYARPYGLSPFASPPLVTAGLEYRGRLRTQFVPPPITGPAVAPPRAVRPCGHCRAASARPNKFVHHSHAARPAVVRGPVRNNPFVTAVAAADNPSVDTANHVAAR